MKEAGNGWSEGYAEGYSAGEKKGFNEAIEEVLKMIETSPNMSMSQIIYFFEEIEKLKK